MTTAKHYRFSQVRRWLFRQLRRAFTLRTLPWAALYAALAVALIAVLVGACGMAAVSIPVCMFALKLLGVAAVLWAVAGVAWFALEAVGVL